ncbi:MAG: PDZ domain-containing protein, partial [Nanoarchaeota archaeon]|nr:PDZ domain-containing protein [Nanoarchaeota archaeon]
MKIKLTWKIWLFIIVLIFALISIFGLPPSFFQKGAVIISVESNSTAFNEGLRQGQIIVSIDGETVNNLADFSSILQQKFPASENVKTIITTTSGEYTFFSKNPPEIIVSDIEKTNIKTGLDLSGGSRALVKAQEKSLSISEVNDLIAVIDNRLNVYGISDVKIAPVSDLAGNNYMLVEIARATPKDLETLISQQGKFEAKIGNETAFIGGERDIASVCRNDATCAGIESCTPAEGGYFCNFRFVVYLSEDAARRHAGITSNLT